VGLYNFTYCRHASDHTTEGACLPKSLSMDDAWTCESIRSREMSWGPMEDHQALASAMRMDGLTSQIIVRARQLGQSIGLASGMHQLRRAGLIALALVLIAALTAGASAALSALGDSRQPVNIVWALLGLVGINAISLLAWLISLGLTGKQGSWIADGWQWLTGKLVKGPASSLAMQSWWSMWQRSGGHRWMLGSLTHAAWALATLSAIVVLLVSLATRHYTFVWETTLLAPGVFTKLTASLGWLPAKLGFPVPDMETIRTSSHTASTLPDAQLDWSGWLIGCITVYGLLPRAALCLLSLVMLYRAQRKISIDLSDPYYMQLVQRLQPLALPPAGHAPSARVMGVMGDLHAAPSSLEDAIVLTAIEPGEDTPWPPSGLGNKIQAIAPIDSRESRHAVTQLLGARAPRGLVIAIDARHTPDRGTLRLVLELSSHAGQTLAWLRHGLDPQARNSLWQSRLAACPGVQVLVTEQVSDIVNWLESC